jgi:hypothetical protein
MHNPINLKTMKKLMISIMVALFATVVLGQTKSEIKSSDLPKCVHEYLTKNFKGFTIIKAYKQDSKGEISFMTIVTKGKDKHTLEFDKNCNKITKPPENTGKNTNQAKEPIKPVPIPPKQNEEPTPKK